MLEGRYFDGKVATEHRVQVRASEGAIVIEGEGVNAEWPVARIDVDRRHGGYRLSCNTDRDARLILPDSFDVRMELKRLGLDGPTRQARQMVKVAIALVVVTLVFVGIIFVGMPMAAEPLARRTPLELEEQFGVNLDRQVKVWMRPCAETTVADAAIAPLAANLATAGELPFDVHLSFVETPMPNAFTLPGGRVMVTRGLLETLDNPDELAAVLAHEMGHVHARDSMVSLYRNMGLGVFLEAVTGGSGLAQQLVLLGGQMAELRFTRAQEERADAYAIQLMTEAGYNPEALARAFEAIHARAEEMRDGDAEVDIPEWMLTHPNIDARISAARAAARPALGEVMTQEQWAQVRAACTAEATKND